MPQTSHNFSSSKDTCTYAPAHARRFVPLADTSLEGAKALVASGEAQQSDFWVFVGYAGWAPKQLEGEVERKSWFLASADSGTLLQELLRQGTELPPPS